MRQLLVVGAVALISLVGMQSSANPAAAAPEVEQVLRVVTQISNQTIRTEAQAVSALGGNAVGGQLWAAVKQMERTLGRPLNASDFSAIRGVIRDKSLTNGLQVVELFQLGAQRLRPGQQIAATFGQVTVTATRTYTAPATTVTDAAALQAVQNYTCDSPATCEAKQYVLDNSFGGAGRQVAVTTGQLMLEAEVEAPRVCPPAEVANCIRDDKGYHVQAAKEGAYANPGGVGFGHDINNAFRREGTQSYVGRGHLVSAGGRHAIEDGHIRTSQQLRSCVFTGAAN